MKGVTNPHAQRLASIVLVAIYVALLDPGGSRFGVPCLFRSLFGLECFACGLTRAASALVRGDVPGAIAHNALIVPSAVLAAFEAAVSAVSLWSPQSKEM